MLSRRFAALTRDDGTAAIEFAIVAPILVMLLCGIIGFASVYARLIEVNAVAAQAARNASAGYAVDGTSVDGIAITTSSSYTAPWYGYYYHDDHDYWGNPGGHVVAITARDDMTISIPFWPQFKGPSSGRITIPLKATVTQRVLRGWTDYHRDDRDSSDWSGGYNDGGWGGYSSGWGGH